MKKLFLVGGGGHCVSCIDVIEQSQKYLISGIFDLPEKVGTQILGYSIIGSDEDLRKYVHPDHFFLITLGQIKSPELRMKKFATLKSWGAQFATVTSPRAYISQHAKLGEGTIILHDALVNSNAQIGENCIVNTKALIEHDSVVSGHCHISTGAIVNGGCSIGEGSFVGSNAVLRETLQVPAKSILGAGGFHR